MFIRRSTSRTILCIGTHADKWYYRIYSLSAVKALPLTPVQDPYDLGGPTMVGYKTVQAHDLSRLAPLETFAIPAGELEGHSFDFKSGMLFYFEGESNEFLQNKRSDAYVTVYNTKGEVVLPRTHLAIFDDYNALNSFGLTKIGNMKAAGIKYYKGKIYLGFAARNASFDGDPYLNHILVYDILK